MAGQKPIHNSCILTEDEKWQALNKLRDATGFGLMDCKRALKECKWNIEDAKSWLVQYRKTPGIFFD